MSETTLLSSASMPVRPALWRPVWRLLRSSRRGLFAMIGLSLLGSVFGLVPPLAIGFAVNALVSGSRSSALFWVAMIALAIVVEAGAYLVSDGLYARLAAHLCRDLRTLMFEGVLRRRLNAEDRAALASRFVSDAETLEELTISLLDESAVSLFDLIAAFVAVAVFGGRFAAVAAVGIVVAAVAMRRLQRPAASAGRERQEALEEMSGALGRSTRVEVDDRLRFRTALAAVAASETRLGWVGAAGRHGSRAVAGLGPVAVLFSASLQGGLKAGTLLSAYLLAGRAFGAAETLFDKALDVELARGAVSRCLALADLE